MKNLELFRATYNMMLGDGFCDIDTFLNYLYDIDGISVDYKDEEILSEYFDL